MLNDTVRASATALPKSRRAALGLFASASAIAVMPAVARAAGELSGNPGQLNSRSLEVDPIFAAIKRHNEALRAFTAVCPRTDDVVAREEGREVTDEDEAAWAAASAAEEEAFEAFAAVSPVTRPGLRAAIHYFLEFDLHFLPAGSTDSFLTALLASPLLTISAAQNRGTANV
jgi:hypothetical protein